MLVLSRRVGEVVVIGGVGRVTVLGVKNNGDVRIGFDFPPDVSIFREEIELAMNPNYDRAKPSEGDQHDHD